MLLFTRAILLNIQFRARHPAKGETVVEGNMFEAGKTIEAKHLEVVMAS